MTMTVSQTSMEGGDAAFPVALKRIQPGWMIALGAITALTGLLAIAFPFVSTLTVEVMVGSLFLTLGLFTTVHAVMERKAEGMWWELLMGLLHIVAGVAFLANPLGGIIALTVMFGVVFVVEGVMRIVMALQMERSKRVFVLVASGSLSVLLGGIVLAGMTNGASLTLLGVLLGVNFIFSGAATMVFGISRMTTREDAQSD